MSQQQLRATAEGIYLTYLLRYTDYALQARMANNVEALYIVARMLAAMIPNSAGFNHRDFYQRLDTLYNTLVNDSYAMDDELKTAQKQVADKIFNMITDIVTPVISSIGIKVRIVERVEE